MTEATILDCINAVFSTTKINTVIGAKKQIDIVNRWFPPSDNEVSNLVEMIEHLHQYKVFLKSEYGNDNNSIIGILNETLDGLWGVANQLNKESELNAIDRLKVKYNGLLSSATEIEEDNLETQALAERIVDVTKSSKEQLNLIKSVILEPQSYIDKFVEDEVQRFNHDLRKNITLKTTDTIIIRFATSKGGRINKTYTLREIAVGTYLRDERVSGYSSAHYNNNDEKLLVARMEGMGLQGRVTAAINTYKSNEVNKRTIVSNIESMIIFRCLDFLQKRGLDTLQGRIVKLFLEGKIRAYKLFYKGYEIHGAFVIHENGHGVLLSIDESVSFEFEMNNRLRNLHQPDYPVFKNSHKIKEWILCKLSLFSADMYKDDSLNDFIGHSSPSIVGFSTIVTDDPYRLQNPQHIQELKNSLFDGVMTKLNEDYDYLIYSRSEYTTDNLINYVKNILTIGAFAVNFIPGIGRIGSFILGAIMDVVNTALVAGQSQLADRPAQAMSYRDEAILAGALTGLGAVLPIVSANRGIDRSLRLLQKAKSISTKYIRVGQMTPQWTRITNHQKVMLLGQSLEDSTSYRHLEKLTKRETVTQSIYHNSLKISDSNLPRNNWGDFSEERENVSRWLSSDVSLLDQANISIKRFIQEPPQLEYITKSGDLMGEAARWIFGTKQRKNLVIQLIEENKARPLKDFRHIYNIYSEMFPNSASLFRPSGTPNLIGTDVAVEGCRQAVNDINLAYVTGALTKEEFGAGLLTAIIHYKPFVQENTEIARMLYVLSQYKEGDVLLKILDSSTELLLNNPQVAFRAPPNISLEKWKNDRKKYIKKSRDKQFEDSEAFLRGKNVSELNIGSKLVNDQTSEFELTNLFNADTGELTIEKMGTLSGLIEKVRKLRFQKESLDWALVHGTILRHYSTDSHMAPQAFVLGISGSTLFDKGLCLPMVYSFAVGLKKGRGNVFLNNLYYGAANSIRSGGESEIIMAINNIYNKPTTSRYLHGIDFGIGNLEGTIDDIVHAVKIKNETSLFALTTDYSADIDAHTMMVGTVIENGIKSFHFYDPDIGYFRYSSLHDLKKAMIKTIGQPEVGVAYNSFGSSSTPRYKMFLIETEGLGELQIQVGHKGRTVKVEDLSGDDFDISA